MKEFDVMHGYGVELERRLRLKTFPIAVKILERGDDVPEGASRPLRDFGHHLSVCQGFAMSRRNGASIALLKEDMWCWVPVIAFGIEEPPDYFFEGHFRYPDKHETLEASQQAARALPRLDYGMYKGIVSTPLTATNFEPDLVVLYCTPAQLSLLLMAVEWKDGLGITSSMSCDAACAYAVVHVIKNAQYHVASPCLGDRRTALAQDDELIFTAPSTKLEDLIRGLRYLGEHGRRLPLEYYMVPEWEMPDEYAKMAKMLGVAV
jgi:uncharacterized protein (DUF169 family)